MPTFRFTTAGESHGPALVAVVEGLPAGLPGLGVLAGIALPAWGELKKAEKGKTEKGKQVEE